MARPKKVLEVKDEEIEKQSLQHSEEPEVKDDPLPSKEKEKIKEEIVVLNLPSQKQLNKQKLDKFIEEETKLVKGRFRNYETPGGNLRVQIRKYPGIPAFDKIMIDNEMYEVPLYVARHLNGIDATAGGCSKKINTCAWPTHGFKWDRDKPMPQSREGDAGIPVPLIGISKWNRRFGFESLQFDTEM
jgi:hypothetical protein